MSNYKYLADWQKKNGPWNKSKYGPKKSSFIKTGSATCEKHGMHKDWRKTIYRTKDGTKEWGLGCRLCLNAASLAQHRDPTKKLANLLRYAISRSREKEREISITLQDLEITLKNQDNRCAITGVKFDNYSKLYGCSIDRIDNKIGYVKSNIQLVLYVINMMKKDLSKEDFINFCNLVSTNN